mmetsp:Transcript_2973/g.11703  ORF Transcript_2973/g.11703 Transcript_2973/m.11703 type:complete len:270 (-) Transcript_2973:64-873(-)
MRLASNSSQPFVALIASISVGQHLSDTRSSFRHPVNTSAGTVLTRVSSAETDTSAVSCPHAFGKASIPTFPSTLSSVSLAHPATFASPLSSCVSAHVSQFLDRSTLVSFFNPQMLFGSTRMRLSLSTSSSSRTRSPSVSGRCSILFFSRRSDLRVVIRHKESGRRASALYPIASFVTRVSLSPKSSGRLAMEFRSQLMDRTLGPSSMTYSGNDDQPASRSDTIPVFPAVSLRLDALVALLKSEPSFSNATVISFVSLEKKSLMSGGSLP